MKRLIIGADDKTDLLLALMADDFERGFLLIDPHGALAEAAANTLPERYTQSACYFDPSDIGHPAGFNVLDAVLEPDRPHVAQSLFAYFTATFPQGAGTLTRQRSDYLLLSALCLLLDAPGSTLLSLDRLLTDRAYRTSLMRHCGNPHVLEFWHERFRRWDPADAAAAVLDLQTKLGTLLISPMLRNILGQPHSTFSLEQPGKIVIANLSRERLGDQSAYLLGALLLTRARIPVYLNDLGFFSNDQLASLFSRSDFTVAVTFLDELTKKLQQRVLGFEEKIVFRTNPDDARRLASYLGLMKPSILTELSPGEAKTATGYLKAEPMKRGRRLRALRRRSRAAHARTRKEVERQLQSRTAAY